MQDRRRKIGAGEFDAGKVLALERRRRQRAVRARFRAPGQEIALALRARVRREREAERQHQTDRSNGGVTTAHRSFLSPVSAPVAAGFPAIMAKPGSPPCWLPGATLSQGAQSPNTQSIVWLRWSLSSGMSLCLFCAMRLSPERTATYCLPSTSNVIGGALKPVPALNFQSCSSVVSS